MEQIKLDTANTAVDNAVTELSKVPQLAERQQTVFSASVLPVVQAAADLYELGFSIGPTKPASKEPYLWRKLCYCRIDPVAIPMLFEHRAGILVITGSISRNLTILDCDDIATGKHHWYEFRDRGLCPWVNETERGFQFWWLSDIELDNIDKHKGYGYELKGHTRYCLAPPSIHPTGVIYQWAEQEGDEPPTIPKSALEWLPLQARYKERRIPKHEIPPYPELSARNRNFIINGAPVGERNHRLFAVACDLNGNDYTFTDARDILGPVAKQIGLRGREIASTIRSAYAETREPARQSSVYRVPLWERAKQWAEQHDWKPMETTLKGKRVAVTKSTAQKSFLACCERARRDNSNVFRASVREVADIAGLNKETANKGLYCLIAEGMIVTCGYNRIGARLLAFGTSCTSRTVTPTGHKVLYGSRNKHPDTFSRGAIGFNGERVWNVILMKPMRNCELARLLRLSPSTVSRHLHKLKAHHMAIRTDKTWEGLPLSSESLDDVARVCGTLGNTEKRKKRHQLERSIDVTRNILGRKRWWENKQC